MSYAEPRLDTEVHRQDKALEFMKTLDRLIDIYSKPMHNTVDGSTV